MEIESQQQKLNAHAPIETADAEEKPLYGHQLDRNFSLLSICATGLVVGNTWVALGGSIVSIARVFYVQSRTLSDVFCVSRLRQSTMADRQAFYMSCRTEWMSIRSYNGVIDKTPASLYPPSTGP